MNEPPNSEITIVVRRDQIYQSNGPGRYPADRERPRSRGVLTFADESYTLPKYTSD